MEVLTAAEKLHLKNRLSKMVDDDSNPSLTGIPKLKLKVFLMKLQGCNVTEIMKETGLKRRTVYRYIENFDPQNIWCVHYSGYKKSELLPIKNDLKKHFLENPPKTYKEAATTISEIFNIVKSESAIRRFMIKWNIYTEKQLKEMRTNKKRK